MRKKLRFIIDHCLSTLSAYKKIPKHSNAVTLEDVGLPRYSTDLEILAAGQREKRLILTSDSGTGFGPKVLFQPKHKYTGVVVVKGSYYEDDQDEAIYRLSQQVDHEELIQKITKVTLNNATITSPEKKVTIYFKSK